MWDEPRPLITVPDRLDFRSVTPDTRPQFVSTIEQVLDGSLDRFDQARLARFAARYIAEWYALPNERDFVFELEWWQLAYTPEGEVAGFTQPVAVRLGGRLSSAMTSTVWRWIPQTLIASSWGQAQAFSSARTGATLGGKPSFPGISTPFVSTLVTLGICTCTRTGARRPPRARMEVVTGRRLAQGCQEPAPPIVLISIRHFQTPLSTVAMLTRRTASSS